MIFNFVYIAEAGGGPGGGLGRRARERAAPLTAEPKRPIRSFENRLSQNSDRAKGVPRTRIFRSNAAFGYFRSLIWPLR